ncbi:flippase-like domain-containing protein, partial [Candidatus Bathyarchaeota archaeon]
MGKKTLLMPLIGIAAFLIYIFIFQVDIGAIFEELKSVNLYIYLIAVIISLLEVFLFSLSWRALINFLDVKLSVIKSYLLVWSGIFVDTLVPAESISGEAMRIYLIAKEKGNNTCGRVVASLVTHRMLGMMMNVIILIAGMSLLYTEGHIDPLVRNIVS